MKTNTDKPKDNDYTKITNFFLHMTLAVTIFSSQDSLTIYVPFWKHIIELKLFNSFKIRYTYRASCCQFPGSR